VYRSLGTDRLKTGEVMEVGCVQPPDEEWAARIESSYKHKPGPFPYHIKKALAGNTDALENYFYIGHRNGEFISGIMTVEHNRVGILGHVYTPPQHRRKGACTCLMRHQMDDFRSRGGGLLLLGTDYDSPPFHIYRSFGFEPIVGESGYMRYATEKDFEQRYYTPGDISVRPVCWEDWPSSNCLTCQPGDDVLRSVAFDGLGQFSFEEGFLHLKQGLEESGRNQAWSALSETGALAGLVMLTPDRRFRGGAVLLDLIVHENFWGQAGKLLEAVEWPGTKVQCYTDLGCPAKVEALVAAGFTREALLPGQLGRQGRLLDVAIYTRNA